ncbi:BrnA antitoxin family protein [Rhizobium yanglingense]
MVKAEAVRPTAKKPLSIRLDQEVVDSFQASAKGYQTRINAVLPPMSGSTSLKDRLRK